MKKSVFIVLLCTASLAACANKDKSSSEKTVETTTAVTSTAVTSTTATTTASAAATSVTTAVSTTETTVTTVDVLDLQIMREPTKTVTLKKHTDGADISGELEDWQIERFFEYTYIFRNNVYEECSVPEEYNENYTLTVSDENETLVRCTVLSDEETAEYSESTNYFSSVEWAASKILITDYRKSKDKPEKKCFFEKSPFSIYHGLDTFWKVIDPPVKGKADLYSKLFLEEPYQVTFEDFYYYNGRELGDVPEDYEDSVYDSSLYFSPVEGELSEENKQKLSDYFKDHEFELLDFIYLPNFWEFKYNKTSMEKTAIWIKAEWVPGQGPVAEFSSDIVFSTDRKYFAFIRNQGFEPYRIVDPEQLDFLYDLIPEN